MIYFRSGPCEPPGGAADVGDEDPGDGVDHQIVLKRHCAGTPAPDRLATREG